MERYIVIRNVNKYFICQSVRCKIYAIGVIRLTLSYVLSVQLYSLNSSWFKPV